MRNCTCVGSCKGADGLGPGWVCALEAEVEETTASSPDEELQRSSTHTKSLEWALDNIYTIARRESKRDDPRGRWGHVLRLCENAGCRPRGVLRDNGGSMSGVDLLSGDAHGESKPATPDQPIESGAESPPSWPPRVEALIAKWRERWESCNQAARERPHESGEWLRSANAFRLCAREIEDLLAPLGPPTLMAELQKSLGIDKT